MVKDGSWADRQCRCAPRQGRKFLKDDLVCTEYSSARQAGGDQEVLGGAMLTIKTLLDVSRVEVEGGEGLRAGDCAKGNGRWQAKQQKEEAQDLAGWARNVSHAPYFALR